MDNVVLSTSDNPYDPFTEWDKWYAYDIDQGYDTCGKVAALAYTSPALSEELNNNLQIDAFKRLTALSSSVIGFENVHYVLKRKKESSNEKQN